MTIITLLCFYIEFILHVFVQSYHAIEQSDFSCQRFLFEQIDLATADGIIGPEVGKTTLMLQMIKQYLYAVSRCFTLPRIMH